MPTLAPDSAACDASVSIGMLVFGEAHLRTILLTYAAYYNEGNEQGKSLPFRAFAPKPLTLGRNIRRIGRRSTAHNRNRAKRVRHLRDHRPIQSNAYFKVVHDQRCGAKT